MTTVKRFKAVIDELDEMELGDHVATGATSVVLASDYDALLAERDALRADAERYRWLRLGNPKPVHGETASVADGYEPYCLMVMPGVTPMPLRAAGEMLDVYVDKARFTSRDGDSA